MLNLSFPPAPTVRFGISKEQRKKVEGLVERYKPIVENRKYINNVLRHTSLIGIAGYYAAKDTPKDKLPLIEEALTIKLRQAKAKFDQDENDHNFSLNGIVDTLDSGRLKGKALPSNIENALEAAITAYHAMLARP